MKKRIIRKYKLKEAVKTVLVIVGLWALLVCYLLIADARIQGLDENSYTEDGHNKSMSIVIKK